MKIMHDAEVAAALPWSVVLGALEHAFTPPAALMPERTTITTAEATYLTMPCADAEGYFGVKQVAVVPGNAAHHRPTVQAWYTLFDPQGAPALACAATLLTRLRTAGASALAAKYLAAEDARTLLLVGTGGLAPWMAAAHAFVRAYSQVLVWGRDATKAARTADEVRSRLTPSVVVEVAPDLEAALHQADVVTVATTALEPLVRGAWLRDAQHLDLVGAFTPEMAEADPEAVGRSQVFVDQRDACRAEAGDLIRARAHGWSFDRVQGDLAELVTGKVTKTAIGPTLFKSVGLAVEDLALAKVLQARQDHAP